MGKNAFLAALFVFLIVADVSEASLHRILERLLGAAPKDLAVSRKSLLSFALSNCFSLLLVWVRKLLQGLRNGFSL
jgi:hypothetical protein